MKKLELPDILDYHVIVNKKGLPDQVDFYTTDEAAPRIKSIVNNLPTTNQFEISRGVIPIEGGSLTVWWVPGLPPSFNVCKHAEDGERISLIPDDEVLIADALKKAGLHIPRTLKTILRSAICEALDIEDKERIVPRSKRIVRYFNLYYEKLRVLFVRPPTEYKTRFKKPPQQNQ